MVSAPCTDLQFVWRPKPAGTSRPRVPSTCPIHVVSIRPLLLGETKQNAFQGGAGMGGTSMARSAHRSPGGHVPWRTYSHTWDIRDVMRQTELFPAQSLLCALRLRGRLPSPATETLKSTQRCRQVYCSHGSMPEGKDPCSPVMEGNGSPYKVSALVSAVGNSGTEVAETRNTLGTRGLLATVASFYEFVQKVPCWLKRLSDRPCPIDSTDP